MNAQDWCASTFSFDFISIFPVDRFLLPYVGKAFYQRYLFWPSITSKAQESVLDCREKGLLGYCDLMFKSLY